MKEIAAGDGLKIDDEAYSLIASLADGSMRDALSIMERCVSECGETLSYSDAVSVLGISPSDTIFELTDAAAGGDTETILNIVNDLVADGRDLNVFIDSLIKHLRDLLIAKVTKAPESLLDRSAEDMAKLKSRAKKIPFGTISLGITLLSDAKQEAKWVKNPRIIYELALIKLSNPELDSSNDALSARLDRIEERIKEGIPQAPSAEEKPKKEEAPAKKKKEVSPRLYVPLDKSRLTPDTPIVAAARKWDKISQVIARKYPFVAGSVTNRRITIDGEGIILIFDKNEIMLKKIAATYIKSIQSEFQKNAGGDFVFKTAFLEDIEDNIIDYWNIAAQDKNDEAAQAGEKRDPLDTLAEEFPEIIEMTDESDFVNYRPEHFEQTELDEDNEDDEPEEFLEDSEKEREE